MSTPEKLTPYFGKQALSTVESSHDTFDESKFRQWLANNAGQGIYAHGRIHQQVGDLVYIGDLIHKRGHLTPSDILLMEEQETLSHSDPLSVPSRLGTLNAMAMLPTMNTANGEGSLIGYYQRGVVAFDTFEVPRETRFDGEGKMIQQGWSTKKLVNHLLNTVSAVGRYAVAVLTRDHLFRSVRGLHFLKTTLGDGSFNTEQTNRISSDVDPLLDKDPEEHLHGAAAGFWIQGDRMFASTGLYQDCGLSTAPLARGFVSWHQALTFTENRTPIPAWEGVWTFDSGIAGIHRFIDGEPLCSDVSGFVYLAEIDKNASVDTRGSDTLPIEWSLETGAAAPAGLGSTITVSDCLLELVVSDFSKRIRVYARTDVTGDWALWKELKPSTKTGANLLVQESLGRPPASCRECTWIQVRVEGVGAAEIRRIDLDFSEATVKAGRQRSHVVATSDKDPFETNTTPLSKRWPQG